ncbi:hypothetical protein DAETH_02310 [Deinococcus aetherius]|uniref:Uncharacterized protein n=1 Tax=Deinococcus aetherius TaxID=200252 RepID=A0ABM8A926_9DEIO|nr:hypothetical protein DAETH_02310 [Deinococcus aetherius]
MDLEEGARPDHSARAAGPFINPAICIGTPLGAVAAIVGHSSLVVYGHVYRQTQHDELQETGAHLRGLFTLTRVQLRPNGPKVSH